MTRLFSPHDYGVYALVNGGAIFGASLCQLSMTNALASEPDNAQRRRILSSTSLLSAGGIIVTGVIVLVLVITGQSRALGIDTPIAVILPAFVGAVCLFRLASSWSVALGEYGRQSLAKLVQAMIGRPVALLLAIFIGGQAWMMVVSELAAYVAQAVILVRRHSEFWLYMQPGKTTFRDLSVHVHRLKVFTYFDYPSQLIALLSQLYPLMILAAFYGSTGTGQFSFANSIGTIPIQIISMSIAPGVLHHIRRAVQSRTAEDVSYMKSLVILLLIGSLAIYAGIAFSGFRVFNLVFGKAWTDSGHIVGLLAMPLSIQFVSIPLLSTLWYAQRTKAKLHVDVVFFIASAAVLLISAYFLDFFLSVLSWAIVQTLYRAAEIWLIFSSLKERPRGGL